jgi:ribosome-associated toxin RatA of RatAB toxin-antitoxin module
MVRRRLVVEMQARPEQVYALLFEIENWTRLLPHCEGVKLESLTEDEQVAVMQIRSGGRMEEIRTVRRFEKDCWISFDQIPAPPPFERHRGRWTLEPTEGGVRVEVEHEIAGRGPVIGWFRERIGWTFFVKRNSQVTLQRIKEELGA